jgi:hypothetical protein
MNIIHPTSVAAALAAATLALPGAALAKGGTSTPPPPAPAPVQCDYALDGPTADGAGYVFSNQAGDAGCITVISSSSGIGLYNLALTPGWTADVKSDGGGTTGGVRVVFTQSQTGQKVDAKIEPGKTWIR